MRFEVEERKFEFFSLESYEENDLAIFWGLANEIDNPQKEIVTIEYIQAKVSSGWIAITLRFNQKIYEILSFKNDTNKSGIKSSIRTKITSDPDPKFLNEE